MKHSLYAYQSLITSKVIEQIYYMTMIRPLLTSAGEIWTLSVWNINNLSVSERQILRKILGPNQSKEGWRIRSNKELQKLIKGEEDVN